MSSLWGLLTAFQSHFQSAVSAWALSLAVRKRDFAKSTEDKRIHSTHSSGTSSSAHRKYQPPIFVWTDNKYYLNAILSSIKTHAVLRPETHVCLLNYRCQTGKIISAISFHRINFLLRYYYANTLEETSFYTVRLNKGKIQELLSWTANCVVKFSADNDDKVSRPISGFIITHYDCTCINYYLVLQNTG